jgi:hypothetical protein
MTSVTGPEVNLDSATGATGATGAEGPSATGGATGPVASGTGGEGIDIAPELRLRCSEFGSRMLSLFTANSTDTDASKFQASAERIMRNMTMDEIVTAMALDDMQAKDIAAMGLDQLVLVAFGQAPSAAPEPGAKADPAMEKARDAEAAVGAAEKAVAAVVYTHAVTAEMTIGGYDKSSFRAAEQDAFKAYVAKVTESKNGAVKIDTLAVVGATLRRRLLAAGKLKIGFSVLSTGADAGSKAAAAINKLKDSPGAAVQGLKEAGLSSVTSAEVTKAATVMTTVEGQAAQFRLHKAIEDAADAQETLASSGKKLPATDAAKPKPKKLKLRMGAGHWQWVLNHKKQWTLSGRADAFWARQQAKVRAIMDAKEKAADVSGAAAVTGLAAATGAAAPTAF